jgi:hypothetical protein
MPKPIDRLQVFSWISAKKKSDGCDFEHYSFWIGAAEDFGFRYPIIVGKFILALFGGQKRKKAVQGINTDSFSGGNFDRTLSSDVKKVPNSVLGAAPLFDLIDFDFQFSHDPSFFFTIERRLKKINQQFDKIQRISLK